MKKRKIEQVDSFVQRGEGWPKNVSIKGRGRRRVKRGRPRHCLNKKELLKVQGVNAGEKGGKGWNNAK